jgi:hypothetical protein
MTTITKTDAAELKALVNQKRELLQEQLTARRDEVRNAVEAEIRKQHAETVTAFEKEVAKLRRRAKQLEADALEVFDSMPTDLEATKDRRWNAPVEAKLNVGFQPKDFDGRVRAAVKKLEEAYSIEKVNLNKRFVDLREELVTMSLDGDAKSFLSKIPTVDEILPLPNGSTPSLKELVAA